LPALNESLNKDMRMLLDDIRAARPSSTSEDESTASHVLLNSYTGKLQ
jgi:hypothetical protein